MKWNYYQFNLSITRHFHFYYPIFRGCNSKPKPIDIHFFGFRLSGSSPLYLWMVDNIIVTILANNDKNLQAIKSNTYLEIVLKTNHRNGGEYFQNVGCIHASPMQTTNFHRGQKSNEFVQMLKTSTVWVHIYLMKYAIKMK